MLCFFRENRLFSAPTRAGHVQTRDWIEFRQWFSQIFLLFLSLLCICVLVLLDFFPAMSYSHCSACLLCLLHDEKEQKKKILKNYRVCKIYNGNEHKSDFSEYLCRHGVETGQDNAQATPGSWKTTPGPGTYRHMSPDRTGKWEAPIERVTSGPLQSKACQGISLPHSLPPLPLSASLSPIFLSSRWQSIHPYLSILSLSIHAYLHRERGRERKRERREKQRDVICIYT